MKNSMILTFLLLLVIVTMCNTTHESSSSMSPELRQEFRNFANKRMEYMLKNGTPKEPHLTMSIRLTDCRKMAELPEISSGWNQLILEEVACSTVRMTHWCKEKPGRQAILTTWSEVAKRTALAHFECAFHANPVNPLDVKQNSVTSPIRTMMHCIVVFSLFAIIRSWYLSFTRPVPVHPSKILNLTPNPEKSDSFESITFNTTRTLSKSRLALSLNRSSFNTSANKFRIIV